MLAMKIISGISVLGMFGFNIAMTFPNNEILIGVSLAMTGAGMAVLPLTNELIVETTYPVGEATSTSIGLWLAKPLSGVLIAISSLIPYGDLNDYPDSVCRAGELQDLSWFFTIMNSIFLAGYLIFAYLYRKFNQFVFRLTQKIFTMLFLFANSQWKNELIEIKVVRICDRKNCKNAVPMKEYEPIATT